MTAREEREEYAVTAVASRQWWAAAIHFACESGYEVMSSDMTQKGRRLELQFTFCYQKKKGRKTLKNMLLILYTWRRWVDDGEWSHLSLTHVALQMLLCVPLTDCASALVPTTQQYLLVLITSALSFPPMCHWFRILGSIQFPRNTLIFLMYDNVMKQLLSCLKHRGMQIC